MFSTALFWRFLVIFNAGLGEPILFKISGLVIVRVVNLCLKIRALALKLTISYYPNFSSFNTKILTVHKKVKKMTKSCWYMVENYLLSIPNDKKSNKKLGKFFWQCIFSDFFHVSQRLFYHISQTVKHFIEIPTVKEPRDRQLEAEILSQKV